MEPATSHPPARLSNARKSFGKVLALDGVDLEVRPGELLALLGPNGAGKTTAISLLLGLTRPDRGAARLFGLSPELLAARRSIGVMVQEAALAPELKVREHVALVASYYPAPLPVDEALRTTRLGELAERPYGTLSGGQKRQVQLAVAIVGRPRLLFLDEPSVGLDVAAREAMWATLRRLVAGGTAVVLTTHYLEEAEALADRVVVLSGGRVIACGTVAEIRSLVLKKRITCASALRPEEIETWEGVESVGRDRGLLQITARDAEAVVRRLLGADAAVSELEVRRAGLAEAFTSLTGSSVEEVAS